VISEPTRRGTIVTSFDVYDPDANDELEVNIMDHAYVVSPPTQEGQECQGGATASGKCCELTYPVFEAELEGTGGKTFSLKLKDDIADVKPFNNLGGCNFTMTVAATDSGDPRLTSSEAYFTLLVRGTNNPPEIYNQVFDNIPENSENGTVVIAANSIIATDDDEEDTLYYYIIPGSGEEFANKFKIHPISGEIRVTDYGAT